MARRSKFKFPILTKRSNQVQIPFWPINPLDTLRYIVGGTKVIDYQDIAFVDFDDGLYYKNTPFLL